MGVRLTHSQTDQRVRHITWANPNRYSSFQKLHCHFEKHWG